MNSTDSPEQVGLVTAVTAAMLMFLVAMDAVMMPIATSAIVSDLQTNVGTIQAAIAVSSLVAAPLYITGGRLGDIYGKKKIFILGFALYGIGTLIATIAPSSLFLVGGWSIVRALGMAVAIPASVGLLIATYTDENRRGQAFSIYGTGAVSAALVGPLLMGYSVDALSWRVPFGVETLLAVGAIFLAWRSMRETDPLDTGIDWIGTLLSLLAIAAILVGSMLGGPYGWFLARRPFFLGDVQINPFGMSPAILLVGVGLVLLTVLLSRLNRMEENRPSETGTRPLFSMRLFEDLTFSRVTIVISLFFIVSGALPFILPVFLQQAIGFDGMQTALVMVAFSVGSMIVGFASGKLAQMTTKRLNVQLFLAVTIVGMIWLFATVKPELTVMQLLVPMFIVGCGFGASAQIPNIQLSTLPADLQGEGSGFAESGKELGVGMGAAVIGSILFGLALGGQVDAVAKRMDLSLSPEERNEIVILLEDARFPDDAAKIVAEKVPDVDRLLTEVNVEAFQVVIAILAAILLLALLFASFIPRAGADESPADDNNSAGRGGRKKS